MAEKTVVEYVDDLDGKPVAVDELQTITWSWRGVDYVIDISTSNLETIEAGNVSLATLLSKSTRIGRRRRATALRDRTVRRNGSSGGGTSERAAIREWAREQGYDIGDRGRISEEITAAYHNQASVPH